MSPEQAAGKRVTARSDLYSLGVVLYTFLVGRPPFAGEMVDLLHKHRYARFDPPIRFVQEMPYELNDIICDLMEKEPEKRPADGGVLLRRLEAVRRKKDRREMPPTVDAVRPGTVAPAGTKGKARTGPGPVTLMSRLMRRDVRRRDGGGPGRLRFVRPLVLLTLLAIGIGIIVWAFWPPGEEQLYQRAGGGRLAKPG